MPKKITKKVADEIPTIVEEEVIETQVDGDSEVTKEYSPEYIKLRDIIEAYKVKNPVKYEQKKEALQAQLNSLK